MSQGAVVIADDDGLAVLAAINAANARFNTTGSGSTRPADAAGGTFWVDTNTPSGTVWTLNFYDGTSDIALGTFDSTAHSWTAVVPVIRSYLVGLTLSAAGGTATFGVAAGQAADSTNAAMMTLASAYTKTASAWAVGSGNGSLDTGAIATGTWYHVWQIQRVDTGVVDVLTSLSATAPTMPTNYTLKRRIGSMKTDGSSQWVKFIQDGDYFAWDAAVLDVADTNPGTASVTKTLASVPTGVNVHARLNVKPTFATTGGVSLFLRDLATSDQAPSDTAAPLGVSGSVSAVGGVTPGTEHSVRTNTSAQIAYRLNGSGASDVVRMAVLGWTDPRGRNA